MVKYNQIKQKREGILVKKRLITLIAAFLLFCMAAIGLSSCDLVDIFNPDSNGDNNDNNDGGQSQITEGIDYEVSDDGTYVSIVSYSGTSLSVTIPDTYNGLPVTEIKANAFENSNIQSVTVGDNVTLIGNQAFRGCSELKSVTIGDAVDVIGEWAFRDCTALESVTFKNTIGWYISPNATSMSGKAVSSELLSDPSAAAEHLLSTYDSYHYLYWKRSGPNDDVHLY